MIKNQENKLTMYDGVHTFLKENEGLFSGSAEMTNLVSSLKIKRDEINSKEDERMNSTIGKTSKKQDTKDKVISMTLTMAGILFAYSKKTNDIELKEKTSLTNSILRVMRDLEMVIICEFIRDNILANQTALAIYGLTSAKTDEFVRRIAEYSAAVGAREVSSAVKSSASKSLDSLFNEENELLKSIDKLMEGFRESEPQFYNGYKSLSRVKNLGVRHKPEENCSANGSNTLIKD